MKTFFILLIQFSRSLNKIKLLPSIRARCVQKKSLTKEKLKS